MRATRILATKALTSFITSSTKTFPKQITRQFSTKATKTYRTIKDDDVSSGKGLLVVGGFAALVTSAIAFSFYMTSTYKLIHEIDEILGHDKSYDLYRKWVSPMLENGSKPSMKELQKNIEFELLSLRHKIFNSNLEITPNVSKKLVQIDNALSYIRRAKIEIRDETVEKDLKDNSKIFKEVVDQANHTIRLRNSCKYARTELDELKSKPSQITKEASRHIEDTLKVLDIVEGELEYQNLKNFATPNSREVNQQGQNTTR